MRVYIIGTTMGTEFDTSWRSSESLGITQDNDASRPARPREIEVQALGPAAD